MNKEIVTFQVDQDWQVFWPEEGSIWEFIAKDYDKDKQRTTCVFRKIGNPISTEPSVKVFFT